MPDKIEKYLIDNELIDNGWEQMQAILDKEMPIKPKRRRMIPFWWLSSGIAAAAVFGSFLFFQQNNKISKENIANQTQNKTIQQESLTNKSQQNDSKEINISSTSKTTISIDKTSTPTQQVKTQISSKKSLKSVSKNDTQTPILATAKIGNLATIQENEIEQVTHNETIAKEDINKNVVNRVTLDGVENLSILGVNKNDFNKASFMPIIARKPIKIKKQRAFQHAIFGRFNYTGIIDNGYTYGYMLSKKIQGKHSLQARVFAERNTRFVHLISETFTVPKSILGKGSMSSVPNMNSDTTFSQIIYPFNENCTCALIAQANNFNGTYVEDKNAYVLLNSTHLGLGINYNYRITPRWDLSTGFGFSYAVKELQYKLQVFESLVNSSQLDPTSGSNINNKDTQNLYSQQLARQRIFSRWDGYFELGANFHVTKRFALGAAYRYGVIDITKNDSFGKKDYNTFGVMQGIFYF
jgi:hypothetical protein